MMNKEEIETLAELISIKTAEKYMQITKEMVDNKIKLHSANCEAKKYKGLKNFISAGIGGTIAVVVDWLIRKL